MIFHDFSMIFHDFSIIFMISHDFSMFFGALHFWTFVFPKKRLAWIRTHARLRPSFSGLETVVVTTSPRPRLRVKGVHIEVMSNRTRGAFSRVAIESSTQKSIQNTLKYAGTAKAGTA